MAPTVARLSSLICQWQLWKQTSRCFNLQVCRGEEDKEQGRRKERCYDLLLLKPRLKCDDIVTVLEGGTYKKQVMNNVCI